MNITLEFKSWLVENGYAQKTWTDDQDFEQAALKAIGDGKLSPQKLAELTGKEVVVQPPSKSPTSADVFGGVNVKAPSARYSTTKSVAKHQTTGRPVRDERGREVQTHSELEFAKAGVLFKMLAQKGGQSVVMEDHERELLGEMFEQEKWCGKIGGEYKSGISGMAVKALLNDATSGGAEVVPEFFDDMIVQFPLLHSELLPHIDLKDVPRGATVEAASIGNPTVTWNVADGTAITPFDTGTLVAGIDTTIFPVAVGIEISRDFLSDAAVDVGKVLVENIGQRMLNELDRVIVVGNGTTEPQGIFNASGMTDIGNPAGGAGATAQVDDYEALMFAVGKQYRNKAMRPAFFANDTSYSRARAIPVGAADVRRVFGMNESSYSILEHPFRVSNDIGNASAGYGALAKYRLYRRKAQEIQFTSEGKELATKNLTLLIVRGRYGGKVMDGSAFAYSDNWEA